MADITFKGNPVHTNGSLPKVGDKAPDFRLVDAGLGEKTLADFAGKKKVLTINPSYDTGVCQASARKFHARVGDRDGVALLVISADLPFAQKRFCTTEGIDGAVSLSSFRATFARDYGVEMVDGPLKGLTARAVVVLDENDVVKHAELVPEIGTEPDFDAALATLD
jgi:thioredoxin-dependent peroxiredoxin